MTRHCTELSVYGLPGMMSSVVVLITALYKLFTLLTYLLICHTAVCIPVFLTQVLTYIHAYSRIFMPVNVCIHSRYKLLEIVFYLMIGVAPSVIVFEMVRTKQLLSRVTCLFTYNSVWVPRLSPNFQGSSRYGFRCKKF